MSLLSLLLVRRRQPGVAAWRMCDWKLERPDLLLGRCRSPCLRFPCLHPPTCLDAPLSSLPVVPVHMSVPGDAQNQEQHNARSSGPLVGAWTGLDGLSIHTQSSCIPHLSSPRTSTCDAARSPRPQRHRGPIPKATCTNAGSLTVPMCLAPRVVSGHEASISSGHTKAFRHQSSRKGFRSRTCHRTRDWHLGSISARDLTLRSNSFRCPVGLFVPNVG